MIQATQVNGCPLPIGSFTAWAVVAMVQRHTGHHPVDVDVMSDWDAVIELELDVRVGELPNSCMVLMSGMDNRQKSVACCLPSIA